MFSEARRLLARIGDQLRSRLAAPRVRELRRRISKIPGLPAGPLVVIAPHPDDESLGCGGLIALKRCVGESVHVVFLTSGETSLAGHPNVSPPELAAKREKEAVAALRVLGVSENCVHFLRGPDGGLQSLVNSTRSQIVANLAQIIMRLRPSIITTPFRFDGHPDHECGCVLTREATRLAASNAQIWEYPVWSLWKLSRLQLRGTDFQHFNKLDVSAVLAAKKQAVACHLTQVAPVAPWRRPTLSARLINRLVSHDELFCRCDR